MTVTRSADSTTRSSLDSLVDAAYMADPADRLIARVSDHTYSTLFRLVPSTLALLQTAAAIEPDRAMAMKWYHHTPIAELGYLSAAQLVALGRADAVIAFLQSIEAGARD